MDLIYFDFTWMLYNTCLALIPVLLIQIIKRIKNPTFSGILLVIWFLFLPNTIYLISDLIHLPPDIQNTSGIYQLIIIGMYTLLVILGIITFFAAFFPFDKKYLHKNHMNRNIALLAINILVGIGFVLGRILRINSWDVLFHPMYTIHAILYMLHSLSLLSFAIFFGLLCLMIYLIGVILLQSFIYSKK